jgi:Rap guanine nucleotide exchange factor 1
MMTFLLLFLYSSLVISATNQVYQSLANLIRWSDTVLLRSDKSLDKESVGEIAKSVYEAVHVNQY